MTDGRVLVRDDGGLRVLTLSRPDRHNGMDSPMLEQLADAVRSASREASVRCILITGHGETFSAGGDPREMTGAERLDVLDRWTQVSAEVTGWIFRAEKPVVAAVDGLAIGAGFALAIACDIVLASQRATFGPVFVQRGIVPDHGALWFLPRLIGLRRALELTLRNRRLASDEAHNWGLINDVVEDDALAVYVAKIAAELADGPTEAFGDAKRLLRASLEHSLESQLAREAETLCRALEGDEAATGLAAFAEKRVPKFR